MGNQVLQEKKISSFVVFYVSLEGRTMLRVLEKNGGTTQ